MKQVESSTGESPSDAELILQVRSGDREAFGVLYERHAGAARALARQYVSPADAEDVVADAFSKLFEMLRRGAGPDSGFRPYLYTVVRHRAFDVSRGAARTRPTTDDEIELVLGRVASEEDPALAGFERSVIAKAYVDLPERWREVLWYVLVDDLKPAQVAPVLGLSPNGVSALLYRAKEALRAGYLQQHLTHAPSDTCRSVNPLLGGYVRESLSKRETTKIDEHLATCGACSALVLELADVAHGMKTVIAPLVLGAGGLALVGAGAPIGGLIAAKAGAAVGTAPAATVTVGAASTGSLSGAVSSAVSVTAGAFASAAAAATGGSVAAGAIAVAAVGMVAALQIAAPIEPEPANDIVIATNDSGRELAGAEEIKGKPVLPTDTDSRAETSSYFVVGYGSDAEPLLARQPQKLSLTVRNDGDAPATGTQLQIDLPDGFAIATPMATFGTGVGGSLVSGSLAMADVANGDREDHGPTPVADATPGSGAGAGSGGSAGADTEADGTSDGEAQAEPTSSPSEPATVGSIPEGPAACMPTEQQGVLLCSLGELPPGQERVVEVPVQVNSGGDYAVAAEVWAEGVERMAANLPDRTVAPFGPELSASTEDVSLSSPGTAALPIRVVSTGDSTVDAGWAVEVTLPDGVSPASGQPEVTCDPGAQPNAWICAPRAGTDAAVALTPGAAMDVALNIVTATPQTGEATALGAVNVRPLLIGKGNARSASATLVATSAWANAADGVGTVTASCLAEGGVDVARSAVSGAYTNTTQRTVRVALEAAGSTASSGKDIAPGETTRITVPDGLRIPAGQAAFALATVVDGREYETRVAAGNHTRADCYNPDWSTRTSVETVNSAGVVGVEGTLTNTTNESLFAVLSVPVGDGTVESERLPVAAGGTQTFSVSTGRTVLPAGDVVFRLSRDVPDSDGDLAAAPIVPKTNPRAHHAGAKIAPARGANAPVGAGVCEFDVEQDRSVQMFSVTADNTASTLPVKFHVGDVAKTVPAGTSMNIEYPVVWGTGTATLTSAGQTLASMDVSFESCAEVAWPAAETMSVRAAAQCTDEEWSVVHLTAAVENRTGRDWTGVLIDEKHGETGPETSVPNGTTTELGITRQLPISGDGQVTVRLSRELEGVTHTVESSFWFRGIMCLGPQCEPTSGTTAPAAFTAATNGRSWSWSRPSCDEAATTEKTPEDA